MLKQRRVVHLEVCSAPNRFWITATCRLTLQRVHLIEGFNTTESFAKLLNDCKVRELKKFPHGEILFDYKNNFTLATRALKHEDVLKRITDVCGRIYCRNLRFNISLITSGSPSEKVRRVLTFTKSKIYNFYTKFFVIF